MRACVRACVCEDRFLRVCVSVCVHAGGGGGGDKAGIKWRNVWDRSECL